MISAQAHIRLGDLRSVTKSAEDLDAKTLVLVRVDEDAQAPRVRIVVLRPEIQAKTPSIITAHEDEGSELAGAEGPALLSMLFEEVVARSASRAPRVLALELELRRRLVAYDRNPRSLATSANAIRDAACAAERERLADMLAARALSEPKAAAGLIGVATWIREGGKP